MYAVIKTGGKQYKVAAGEKIKVEQIAADVGQTITIDQVLAVGSGADLKIGDSAWCRRQRRRPRVVAHGRHDKVRIFKMRRRKHYQKRQGHRQNFTEIRDQRGQRAEPAQPSKEFQMAQKKGGGSTRNGRDSQPKMLGVKVFGGQGSRPARSSCASAAPSSMPAPTSASAATTRCSRWSTAR